MAAKNQSEGDVRHFLPFFVHLMKDSVGEHIFCTQTYDIEYALTIIDSLRKLKDDPHNIASGRLCSDDYSSNSSHVFSFNDVLFLRLIGSSLDANPCAVGTTQNCWPASSSRFKVDCKTPPNRLNERCKRVKMPTRSDGANPILENMTIIALEID